MDGAADSTSPTPAIERLMWFWHGHFATSMDKVEFVDLVCRQLITLRRHGLGRFDDLLMAVTLDPANDSPEALREYAKKRGADLANWSFLTGSAEDIQAVLDAYAVGSLRQPDGQIDHVVVTYVLDPEGRIARIHVGLDHDAEELERDLRRILS